MPCRYDGPDDDGDRQLQKELLDSLTRMLCHVCSTIEKDSSEMYLDQMSTPELRTWWRHHKVIDAKRKREEQTKLDKIVKRNIALEKLTKEERKILGV